MARPGDGRERIVAIFCGQGYNERFVGNTTEITVSVTVPFARPGDMEDITVLCGRVGTQSETSKTVLAEHSLHADAMLVGAVA